MIDVDKDKLICVSFPAGSGGHFIVAALSLSGRCLPASTKWLRKTMDPKVLLDCYLTSFEQSIIANKWQDFGIKMDIELLENPATECLPTDMSLLGVMFSYENYVILSKIWKNLTVIHFTNCAEFGAWRTNAYSSNLNHYWQTVKGANWPDTPPTSAEELESYPPTIRQELVDKFDKRIMNYLNLNEFDTDPEFKNEHIPYTELCPRLSGYDIKYTDNHNVIKWNCQNFFSKANTIDGVEKLYQKLQLPNFDVTAVSTLYQKWISTLRALNNKRIA